MAGNKKPRKPRRQKPCVLPLGMRDAGKFEMPGYQASLALGQDYFCEQHIYDLVSNADMTRRIAKDGDPILPVAEAMVLACAEIQQRAARTGKHGVTGDELRVLREGVAATMDFLRNARNVDIDRAAREALREFNRSGVLRV
jgi:hypothetical protein